MKKLSEEAKKDQVFQYCLTFQIERKINKLIEELQIFKHVITVLKDLRDTEPCYTPEAKYQILDKIEGCEDSKFTLAQAQKLYHDKKLQYHILINCCELAAKEDFEQVFDEE